PPPARSVHSPKRRARRSGPSPARGSTCIRFPGRRSRRNKNASWCGFSGRHSRRARVLPPANCLWGCRRGPSSDRLLRSSRGLHCNVFRKTRPRAFVADQPIPLDKNFEEKGIIVAICGGRKHFEPVAGGLALSPKLVAGAAEECH